MHQLSNFQVISLCSTMAELDFRNSLNQITCPGWIVWGEKDKANKKASGELAEFLKHSQCREIPKTGHEVNLEIPEKLASLLREFYKTIRPRMLAAKFPGRCLHRRRRSADDADRSFHFFDRLMDTICFSEIIEREPGRFISGKRGAPRAGRPARQNCSPPGSVSPTGLSRRRLPARQGWGTGRCGIGSRSDTGRRKRRPWRAVR